MEASCVPSQNSHRGAEVLLIPMGADVAKAGHKRTGAEPTWERLARAALDGRDAFRRLHLLLTRAEQDLDVRTEMLREARELAAENADRLRLALKHPG